MGYDTIVVGAGHNGLVCAAVLAKAGQKVLVVEASDRLGGAAGTREFAPGFKVSGCAHLLHLMPQTLIDELGLSAKGFALARSAMPTTALSEDGPLAIGRDSHASLAHRSAPDAEAFPAFADALDRFGRTLFPIFGAPPPRLGTTEWEDRLAMLRLGWNVRRLGRKDMREFLRIVGMNVYDLLEDNFESPLLKGALGFDAVLGGNLGPRSPGSVFTLLYRLAAAGVAERQALALPRGGLGRLPEALAASARQAGALIRTESAVERIRIENDRVCGVTLTSGESIAANTVISSADPKTTFLQLLAAEHLDTGFVRRVTHLRTNGLAAKLHLALDRAPAFGGVASERLGTRLVLAPSLEYLERAFNHTKYGEYSREPSLEIIVPSVHDPALAPAGHHVLSAIVQYAPYTLVGGWEGERERFLESILTRLEEHAPGLRSSIVAVELLTPVDIESQFRIVGGHWHH